MTKQLDTPPLVDLTLLQRALRTGCRVTGWPIGNAYFLDPAKELLEPVNAWSLPEAPWAQTFRYALSRTPIGKGQGIVGRAYIRRRPQWMPDATCDRDWPLSGLRTSPRIRAAVAVPVAVDDRVEAVLVFWSSRVQQQIDKGALALLSRIARRLATRLRRTHDGTFLPSAPNAGG
ncbi:MAG: GAF domain-containing protein [Bryobacteraceae bacterium]